jgi:antitoxin (DNA-binding transcriptional repressor) of toxin-antitoxin stability system
MIAAAGPGVFTMTHTVDVAHPDMSLDQLVQLAHAGDDVVVIENDRAVARLIPERDPEPASAPFKRVAGLHAGLVDIADDFDAPLPDSFWLGEA